LGGISPISPEIPKIFQIRIIVAELADRPIFLNIFIDNIYLLLYNTRKSKEGSATGGGLNGNRIFLAHTPIFSPGLNVNIHYYT
jgi:hypothetical protein